jgi:plastocyanin
MRTSLFVAAAVIAVAAAGCSSNSPVAPAQGGEGGGGTTTTISILQGQGNQTFYPSPSTAVQGSRIAWSNTDSEIHHVAATDGSFDTGDLVPGQTSGPIVLGTDGANYYCTLHAGEVGSINSSKGVPPPCAGPHCG